jgi:hypothetical protein
MSSANSVGAKFLPHPLKKLPSDISGSVYISMFLVGIFMDRHFFIF